MRLSPAQNVHGPFYLPIFFYAVPCSMPLLIAGSGAAEHFQLSVESRRKGKELIQLKQ